MDLRFLLLLACFFLSGFAALLYQTAWTRELSFVFGTSDLAVAVVLAAYMGGLALGASAAARFASRLRRPVLVYGILELAIALFALAVPLGIRALNFVYVALLRGGDRLPDEVSTGAALFQLVSAALVLVPPTALMGATLPLLARHAVRRAEQIGSRIGVLYAINTAGAIAGTLVAAFLLLPELGLRRTVWFGALLNALVFGLAALLARNAPLVEPTPQASEGEVAARPDPGGGLWILPAIALSGAVSFAYEVAWTRLLGQLLGASTHAFATMLASFLIGIALGSAVAARFASTRTRSAAGFALAQLGIAIASYGAFLLCDRLPDLAQWLGARPGAHLASVGVAVATLLPTTLCVGATFPFAVRVLAAGPQQAAAATARTYAWNTVGAIAGSLGAGFFLLPALGFEGTMSLAIAANLALALSAALLPSPRRWWVALPAAMAAVLLVAVPLAPPWRLLSSSPMDPWQARDSRIEHHAVGRTTTVMLLERGGRFQLTTGGLPESWIYPKGMLPQVGVAHWLGALPALLRPETRDLLVIGLGGGAMIELAPHSYESIDVIELEPEVLIANQRLSKQRARDPLADPRVRVVIGDARGALQLLDRQYDAIVSQPSHPWTAGASHLYTREFFSLVRSRLSPDGVFVQWVGIRFVDEELLGSLLAALSEVFPHVQVFRPHVHGFLFAASQQPIDVLDSIDRALSAAPDDWSRHGIHRIEDFASAWALDEQGVRAVAGSSPPNTDDLNFLAARSAQLRGDSLDPASARLLLDPHDPLRSADGLDRAALARSLVNRGQSERAIDVAMAGEGAAEEAALGWAELAAGRTGRATRHFVRALELDPESRDAVAGWVASQKLVLTTSGSVPEVEGVALDTSQRALIEGWQQAQAADWDAVARLDPELAAIEPGDGLFDAATRLRIAWRLARADEASAAQAQALADLLLLKAWSPYDALLRARAALRAGRPQDAWGSLQRIVLRASGNQRGRAIARRALEVARELPGDDYQRLRDSLEQLAQGRRPRRSPDDPEVRAGRRADPDSDSLDSEGPESEGP